MNSNEPKKEPKKMGRPRKENPNTNVYTFKTSEEQLKRLKAYCVLTGRTPGEVIRAAIDNYIDFPEQTN